MLDRPTRIDPAKFARELALRGITATDLRGAGPFDRETIAAFRAGRPVRESTLLKLEKALAGFPLLAIVGGLLNAPAAAQVDEA